MLSRRAKRRAIAAPGAVEDSFDEPMLPLPFAARDEGDAPFDPPDERELMGAPANDLDDGDEEALMLISAAFAPEPGQQAPANDLQATDDAETLIAEAIEDEREEEASFDAPSDEAELTPAAPAPIVAPAQPMRAFQEMVQPAPSIKIVACWDRPDVAHLLAEFADDRRMARADIVIERGGLDGVMVRLDASECPDLIIIDTTLKRVELLASLDRIAPKLTAGAKLIVIGAVNDVSLLRELAARGVVEYIVPPMRADELVRAVCRQYLAQDSTRVIAVIGARGGVGASTIARNVAWSIAERQQAGATLLDLDICFGAGALDYDDHRKHSIADALRAPEQVDDAYIESITVRPTPLMQVLTASSTLERAFELESESVTRVLDLVRRTSPYVVLDLPHAWSAWVKQILLTADDVVVVSTPDLASLRNAKNIIDFLKQARPREAAPLVALSMTGVPLRPEFSAKDITETLGAPPAVSFAFDSALFGAAELKGQMLAAAGPQSKAALTVDVLAAMLTGRQPVERRRYARATGGAPLMLVHEAPPRTSDYIARAREAAQSQLEPEAPPKQKSSITLRIAACLTALIVLGAWYIQNKSDAEAASTPVAEATARPQAPPPAPDNAARYAFALELIAVERAAEAREQLQRLAEAGYAPAQHRLAKLYERGEGVEADGALARRWTEAAARAGHAQAMHDFGAYLAEGEARNDAEAARWFQAAAERGVADSQYNMGVLTQEGRGVEVNTGEALYWFLLAARGGDAEAGARASELAEMLPPLEVEAARMRAADFAPQTQER